MLGLSPLVYDAICQAEVHSLVRPDELARFAAAAALNAAQNALFARTAAQVQRHLAGAGIASLTIKGTAFALSAPAYYSVRRQSDVDLLVEPGRAEAAWEALLALGFRGESHIVGFEGRSPDGAFGRRPIDHHLPPLEFGGVSVELHTRLPGADGSANSGQLWKDRITSESTGLVTPSLDDQLGILCDHVYVHHHGQRSLLPRHVSDFHVLVAAGASIESAKANYSRTVALSEKLVEESRVAQLRPDILSSRGASEALAPWWMIGTRLGTRLFASWRAFAVRGEALRQNGLSLFFPAPSYMAWRYGFERRPAFLVLLYPWRWLSAVWKVVSGR